MKQLKERFREVLQVLKPMSWRARIEHIFTYYKWIFVAIIGVAVLISIGVNALSRYLNPPIYRGAAVGVTLTQQAEDCLTQQLRVYLDGADTRREAVLRQVPFYALDDPKAASTNQAAYYQLSALVAGQELEYVIMDENAWSLLKDGYFFEDLENLLPQETISRLQPYIQWAQDKESGQTLALGIDISHLDFVKENILSDGPVYLAFPGNTDNSHLTNSFIDYLIQYTSK